MKQKLKLFADLKLKQELKLIMKNELLLKILNCFPELKYYYLLDCTYILLPTKDG